ncbi:hypothetical protein [Nocardioides pantholopis]|uniref:hypothetical protein n=1 Tax=Nocardioides pantholopis TaxID=2483798 RepID=UPI000F099759|nr:hypothetical protein [Nocardioides pantholopis]
MNRYAEIDALLRSTHQAFLTSLHAVLEADRGSAAAVLAGARLRQAQVADAEAALRRRAWVPAPQLARELAFVAGIARLGAATDRLAAHTAGADAAPAPSPALSRELTALADAGDRRFRQLIAGASGGGPNRFDQGCARALFEIADHSSLAAAPVVELCAGVAIALLDVGRQAQAAA